MHIFYAPGINGESFMLNESESKHCIRVLRMTKGTLVRLIDGKGNLYNGIIDAPDQKACMIRITGVIADFEKRNYRLHIAISPLKNSERFDWFIEKSVEIGVDEITPILCTNTEKRSIKTERVNNIIISAMKQSLKTYRTILNNPCSFNNFIQTNFSGKLMIAHCNNALIRENISEVYFKGDQAVILIGPEGDFTSDEIDTAVAFKYRPVHLGTSRLRTETAGIAACHSINFINQ